MKQKNFSKKLILNRRTIAHLHSVEIRNVFAGKDKTTVPDSLIQPTCGEPTCITKSGVPCIGC